LDEAQDRRFTILAVFFVFPSETALLLHGRAVSF